MTATGRRARGVPAVMVFSLLAAACGSTVPVGQDVAAGPGQSATELAFDDGMGLSDSAGSEVADDATGLDAPGSAQASTGGSATATGGSSAPGSGSQASGGGSASANGGTSSSAASSTSGAQTGQAGQAPGLTADEIFLGFLVNEGGGEANEAIGAAGVTQGQPREYVRIVVEDLNRRGGIAGRTVKPVIFAFDSQSAAPDEQQQEQACAYWTQDNEVFAAAAPAASRDTLRSCMDKQGVPLLGTGLTIEDAKGMASFPLYVEPNTMNLTRISQNLVPGLARQKYFEPESAAEPTKVGVVRFDYPTYERAYNEALKPALRAQGIDDPVEFAVRQPPNSTDLGGTASDINAAILRFRQENVNHVLILETSATLAFLFMRSAENQRYRPQYGMHTQNGAQALAELVPAEQLHGAVGIGWLPQIDVRDGDVPASPARDRCLNLMRSNGIQFPDKNAKGVALIYCDQAQMFKRATEAGDALTGQGFVRGVAALGTSFPSALTIATRFSAQQRDGAAVYRDVRFHDNCTCFKYSSGNKRAR